MPQGGAKVQQSGLAGVHMDTGIYSIEKDLTYYGLLLGFNFPGTRHVLDILAQVL
jgi:hypothetical protein